MTRLAQLIALSLILLLAGRAAEAGALLRSNVMVDGDVIKLGDIFDDIGDKADISVARAPAPGRRVTVDAEWLAHVATINGLEWRPRDSFVQATIERNGVTIGSDQIIAALTHALAGQGVPASAQVELSNRSVQMVVPAGSLTEIAIRDLSYDPKAKRFTATVEIPGSGSDSGRLRVAGRVFATIEIPVLAHPVNRGDVIAARDLSWSSVREETLRRDVVTDIDQIIGMTPRQSLRANQLLSTSDLQKPLAVTRGALVTMILKAGAMSLSAQGRALDQGSVGDVIHLTNTHSNLTVEGTIEGPNRVSVPLNGGIALAN